MCRHGRPFGLLLAAALVPLPRADGADPFAYRFAMLDANRIAAPLSNVGAFGTADSLFNTSLEFPRGSGKLNFFPMSLWIGANVNGARQGTILEYSRETRPGPMIGGTYALFDTTYKVYKVSHSDTTGRAEWMAHAVPLGAPTDSGGSVPGVLGSQTLWTVYNDADPTLHATRTGTTPLGVEIRQTVWAFKEHGPRDNVVLFRWRIENKGVQTLDSVYVGVWTDSDFGGPHAARFASDPALGMVYSYPDTNLFSIYGDSTPAMGIRLLEGARATPGGADLGATAINPYYHGLEPATAFEFGNLLRGLEVDGSPLVDPTTGLPTPYRFSGDPRTGVGWIDTLGFAPEMRTLVASGPFTMAPGDTQQITAALVVGWGPVWNHSLDSLYVNAQTDFFAPLGDEYVDPTPPDTTPEPPPLPTPALALAAWPNPAQIGVRFSFVPATGTRYRLDVYDVRGRHVSRIVEGVSDGQAVSLLWVPPDFVSPLQGVGTTTGWPGSGLYFAVLDFDGRRTTERVVLLGR
jgi:hypothetical protein